MLNRAAKIIIFAEEAFNESICILVFKLIFN